MLPNFYQRLEKSGWICFAPESCETNEQCGEGILCQPHGDQYVNKIVSQGQNVPWAITKVRIQCTDLMAEARTRMSIVCSRISPCGNISNILVLQP
ncbi:hypothetical protein RDI58_007363 [Solanum bulbocastanum]|uniref:Uncharacterized protein n=1 Tax=Solanum bulbocastanum TaxID=147425 RepID=A0AAN8TTW5_SOLBU